VPYHSPGALHIHSRYSDGTGEIDEIARAAAGAGLEWIGMTDHNTLDRSYRGLEGMRNGVAVLVGYEWTPVDPDGTQDGGDHMLVYGEAAALGDVSVDPRLPPAEAIVRSSGRGALTHLAHPDERRRPIRPDLRPLPWHDWSVRGFAGLELWNYMSEWTERLTRRNMVIHALLPNRRLCGPTDRLLAWWDRLNVPLGGSDGAATGDRFAGGSRLTVGVSGTDAHAHRVRFLSRNVTIFPYGDIFRGFTNYLLLRDPLPSEFEAAQGAILGAMRDGRLYFANRRLGDALGLEFELKAPDGSAAGPGEALAFSEGTAVCARSPRPATLRILRDGTEVARGRGRTLAAAADRPGSYRLEARRFGEAWAYTNPTALLPDGPARSD
jgi:hypothetical protein